MNDPAVPERTRKLLAEIGTGRYPSLRLSLTTNGTLLRMATAGSVDDGKSTLVGRLLPATAQRLGMVVFVVGVTGILVALVTTSVVVMTTATIVASVGQGMGVSASMRALLLGSTAAERPSLMAAIYLACYTGAMVPSIIAGQLSHVLPTVTIAFGYGVLALVATAITLVFARNPSGA